MIAAAATDILDGRIARSFNSVSKFGRVLDPVADKAMQGVMLAYLVPRYPLAKTCTDSVCGQRMLHDGYRMEGDHGNENDYRTTVAWQAEYGSDVCSCDDPDGGSETPYSTSNVLIGACAVCMAMSLGMYASQFREILEQQNGSYRKMHGRFSREN